MVKVNGLWVHQGSAEAGANWDDILTQVDIFFDTKVLVAGS